MLTIMRVWRRHPILASAGVGAVSGAVYAFAVEIDGYLRGNSSAVLPLFVPGAHGPHAGQMNAIQTAGLLLIQVAGNMLGFAVLLSVPVVVAVGVRRILRGRGA